MRQICRILILSAIVGMLRGQQSGYEVVHITELARHGARNTITSLVGAKIPDLPLGALTPNGMRMHFNLGTQIRSMYPTIFNSNLKPNEAVVKASSSPRCIMSATSHLMGIFPLGTMENVTADTNSPYVLPPIANFSAQNTTMSSALPFAYKPYYLEIESYELNTLFFPDLEINCPGMFKTWIENYRRLNRKYEAEAKPISDMLKAAGFDPKTIAGADSFNMSKLGEIYDEVAAYMNHTGALPKGISQEIWNRLYDIGNVDFSAWYLDDRQFLNFITDRMSREFIASFDDVVTGAKNKTKYQYYSGHDTNVHAFTMAFNRSDTACLAEIMNTGKSSKPCERIPRYASSYIFEISKKSGTEDHFVRVLYNGKPISVCSSNQDLHYCAYKDFKSLIENSFYLKKISPYVYCANPLTEPGVEQDNIFMSVPVYIWIGMAATFLLLAAIAILMVAFESKIRHYLLKQQGIVIKNESLLSV